MDLTTGKEITWGRVTSVPMTDTVKRRVETMAVKQGITKMKFTNRKGVTLAHHDWIAGVDYDSLKDQEEISRLDREIDDEDIDELFDNDAIVKDQECQITNSLVEDVETVDKATENDNDDDMQSMLDGIIDELNDEIIPDG